MGPRPEPGRKPGTRRRSRTQRVLLRAALGLGAAAALFVLVVGPWPVYRNSRFSERRYYREAASEIRRQAEQARAAAGPLQAGWASRELFLPEGTPLAGYGSRRGKPATGTHDPLSIRALVLDNGRNRAVVVGSDLLIVPHNVAKRVRSRVWAKLRIAASEVLFNATHTHSGPGAGTRGLVARLFAGRFRREVEQRIVETVVSAIEAAAARLSEAEIGWGSAPAPAFIRNRTRSSTEAAALVDDRIDYLAVHKPDGRRCCVVRYSAHPTVIGSGNMEFSAGFPGYFRRHLEERGFDTVIYLAGAVGSMGPRVEAAGDDFEKAHIMGRGLGEAVKGSVHFRDTVSLRSLGVSFLVPPLQLRFAPGWRLSPLFLRIAGIRRRAWMSAVAIDELLLVGLPCDLSGEIAAGWREEAAASGIELVPLSFSGAYVGYVSPDAYYDDVYEAGEPGRLAYETAVMSWCGPDQEAFFTSLFSTARRTLYGR